MVLYALTHAHIRSLCIRIVRKKMPKSAMSRNAAWVCVVEVLSLDNLKLLQISSLLHLDVSFRPSASLYPQPPGLLNIYKRLLASNSSSGASYAPRGFNSKYLLVIIDSSLWGRLHVAVHQTVSVSAQLPDVPGADNPGENITSLSSSVEMPSLV